MYQWPRIVVTARWPPLRADGFNEVANSLLITPNILTRNDLNRSLKKNDASLIKSIAAWPLAGSNHSSLISNHATQRDHHAHCQAEQAFTMHTPSSYNPISAKNGFIAASLRLTGTGVKAVGGGGGRGGRQPHPGAGERNARPPREYFKGRRTGRRAAQVRSQTGRYGLGHNRKNTVLQCQTRQRQHPAKKKALKQRQRLAVAVDADEHYIIAPVSARLTVPPRSRPQAFPNAVHQAAEWVERGRSSSA
jgi:hypothetical protein